MRTTSPPRPDWWNDRSLLWRFQGKVDTREPGECWPWTGATNPAGYGVIVYQGRFAMAHRVAWAIVHDRDPGDMFVCHHCDNPPCVNPSHLFRGTHTDNMRDMVAKGRRRGGPDRSSAACRAGHAWTQENTYIVPATGARQCVECRRARARRSR